MKNMKIGAKIMLGFGVVIVMMLVIAVVVVVSNLNSIKNVDMIDHNSTLQSLSAGLRSNYLNSRVPANLLNKTMDPATYNQFTELANATEKSFEDVNAYIDANSEIAEYKPSIQSAQAAFTEWRKVVDTIGHLNEEQAKVESLLPAGGQALVATVNSLIDEQLVTIATEINTGTETAALLRRAARITSANNIIRDIGNARVLARQITGTFDPSTLPDTLALFDKAIADTTVYRDDSQRAVQREGAQAAIDAITDYRNLVNDFGQICVQSTEAQAKMPALNAAAQSSIGEALTAIDEAMAARVISTESSATTSLITVIVILILAILSSVVMAIMIMRSITGPVEKMHRVIDIVGGTGRLKFSDSEKTDIKAGISKDEIGQSIESFTKMIDRLEVVAASLEQVAAGDLTVDLRPITGEDTMGVAVSTMVGNLNNMFADINASTIQVSTGASQIADGAQMLAQGATEQSATVEQLSASVTQVSEQTRNNAAVAEEARSLEDNIKGYAEQGSEQMGQMMQAVRDISEASQSIGKVIKIIDDIAFQTNILALNAAVEAARAGQHGKGFAVVADEVRNLAAKSAAAAKDTGELIETSIKKSEMGATISEETAKSLNRIVEGIMQSSQLVAEIARSSGEQSIAISQISEGIDQVSQVVQQNSATSEQSAAASQEMSGQAALLKQLISQFKLKEEGMTPSGISYSPDSSSSGFAIESY